MLIGRRVISHLTVTQRWLNKIQTTKMSSITSTQAEASKCDEKLHSTDDLKRTLNENQLKDENLPLKKQKLDELSTANIDHRKKKVAMLIVYSGKGYSGMQRNPGFKTIESDLLEALVKAGTVRPDHIEQPGVKMAFQRAARTDKGVSAAGQIVSLKNGLSQSAILCCTMLQSALNTLLNNKHGNNKRCDDNVVENINRHLPEQIRVFGLKRVTKGFDSKNSCDSRTYSYVTPTFAFAPVEEMVTENYRVSDEILQRVQDILKLFKGTHNFHNFTSGKKFNDPSAKRYIMEFSIGKPFVHGEMEFVEISIRGQSFMLHQIRKMIGITIAIMRGMTGTESIQRSWEVDKVDVPKAPGLGLCLEQLHYDAYNRKYGTDGLHEKIEWLDYKKEIESFKENYIYPTIFDTESKDKSMLNWLATLPLHHYGVASGPLHETSPLACAEKLATENQSERPSEETLAESSAVADS